MRCLPPELVTPASVQPVTLAEAKAHCRVDHGEDDARLNLAIDAATRHLDGYGGILGRALLKQRWRQHLAFWPASRCIDLALAPVLVAGVVVTARLADGSSQVLDPGSYRLLAAGSASPRLLFSVSTSLPGLASEPDAVAIEYDAGYGEVPAGVPGAIRAAILMMVGDLYRFTESAAPGTAVAVPMTPTVDRLLAPYRRILL
jgi:uncharacterized phiE125 gp8 family phage protein